jgi:hypothetical protein
MADLEQLRRLTPFMCNVKFGNSLPEVSQGHSALRWRLCFGRAFRAEVAAVQSLSSRAQPGSKLSILKHQYAWQQPWQPPVIVQTVWCQAMAQSLRSCLAAPALHALGVVTTHMPRRNLGTLLCVLRCVLCFQIPSDPKLITATYEPDRLSKFFLTTVEQQPRRELLLPADVGIPIRCAAVLLLGAMWVCAALYR